MLFGHVDYTQQQGTDNAGDDTFMHAYPQSTMTLAEGYESKANLAIQFRGTLYNRAWLKKTFSIDAPLSDAMLIMTAYEKWGTSLLSHLDGIFSFVLFDTTEATLFLAKDRVSIEPLFYYHREGHFIFGSALKEFAAAPYFIKSLNLSALSNYFTYGYILQPNTIYENCFKVKSGYFLLFDIATQKIQEKKYWGLGACYDSPKLKLDEGALKEEAARLLQKSIHKRLTGAGRYGASLSGGYDSSTIAAFLQQQSQKPIRTFTIGFEDETINEAPDAKRIAQHLGSDHIEHYFSASDALKIVPQLSDVYDEPFYDNGSIPTTLLSGIAAEEGIDTIFAGDGGDEVFATADDIERFDTILSIPQGLRNLFYGVLNSFNPSRVPYLSEIKNIPTKYYKFIHIIKARNIPEMVKIKMTLFHPYEIETLIQSKEIAFESIFDTLYFGPYAQSTDKVIGSYFKTFMTDGELIKTTNAFAQHHIAMREPYLDFELIDFMAKVPAEIKIKDGIKKNLLKQIAHDMIPRPLMDRPKKGFSVPFSQWMRHELKPLLLETLSEENLKKDGILNPRYVTKLKNAFLEGKEEYKYKLWSILLYQLWYEKHMR